MAHDLIQWRIQSARDKRFPDLHFLATFPPTRLLIVKDILGRRLQTGILGLFLLVGDLALTYFFEVLLS
jgi:hypothetical protein